MGTRTGLVVLVCAATAVVPAAACASGGPQLLFQSKSALATAITRQPDGKLLIGGDTGAGTRYAVVRLTKSGKLDRGFGSKGITEIPIGGGDFGDLTQVMVQPDGGILATGTAGAAGSAVDGATATFGLARLLPSGKIDSGFHQNGRLLFTFGQRQDTAGWTVRRPDGDYVVGGNTDIDQTTIYACATVLDSGLNPIDSLKPLCTIPGSDDSPTFGDAIAQPDNGTIVSIGGIQGGDTPVFGIGRLASDGQFDTSFGDQGFTLTNFGPYTKALNQTGKRLVRARPGGGWIVAGSAPTGFGVVGFTAQGAIDPSFGSNGKLLVNVDGTSAEDILIDVVPLAGGKYVAVGQTEKQSRNSPQELELARFTAEGTLDPSFGNGGRLVLGAAKLRIPSLEQVDAALGNPDGSLIVVGATHLQHYAMLVVKLKPNGALDSRFGR